MLDWISLNLAVSTPIQETIHVTKYPSSIWVLVLVEIFSLLPVILVSIAMLFLHRSRQTKRSLRLFVLALTWSIVGLAVASLPLLLPLVSKLDLKILAWTPLGLSIIYQLLFIVFAFDLVAFCRNSFYGVDR